jgi:hypothetical protein
MYFGPFPTLLKDKEGFRQELVWDAIELVCFSNLTEPKAGVLGKPNKLRKNSSRMSELPSYIGGVPEGRGGPARITLILKRPPRRSAPPLLYQEGSSCLINVFPQPAKFIKAANQDWRLSSKSS